MHRICTDQLNGLRRRVGQWKLAEVSKDDMLGIKVETGHNHSIPGSEALIRAGQTVGEAVVQLRALDPSSNRSTAGMATQFPILGLFSWAFVNFRSYTSLRKISS